LSYRRSRQIGISIYCIPIGVKSTAQIFGLFGDQKYSDAVSRIWFIPENRVARFIFSKKAKTSVKRP